MFNDVTKTSTSISRWRPIRLFPTCNILLSATLLIQYHSAKCAPA